MTRPQHQRRLMSLSAALSFVALPALAQGTAEQREACTPDAIRLCQDTIPDVERTSACMRRHQAELTPRCRAAFLGTGSGAGESRRVRREEEEPASRPRRAARPYDEDQRAVREAPPRDEDGYGRPGRFRDPGFDEDEYARERVPPAYVEPGVREYRYLTPGGDEARAPDPGDRARARENVRRLCEDGAMDPETCATTDGALGR